jgi:hypothetical protein
MMADTQAVERHPGGSHIERWGTLGFTSLSFKPQKLRTQTLRLDR